MASTDTTGFLTQTYEIDMTPGSTPAVINVSQHDTGRILELKLINSYGTFTMPENVSAVVHGTKADTTGFEYEVSSISTVNASVTFALKPQMTAAAGPAICEIVITDTTKKKDIATANFILMVEKTAMDDETLKSATDVYNLLKDIQAQVEIATTAADDAETAVTNITTLVRQAREYASAAEQAADQAEEYSKLSESYAKGGTGTRTGEDRDNSKYYSETAAQKATDAQTASQTATTKATEAEQSADRAMKGTPDGYEEFYENALTVKGTADNKDLNTYKTPGIYLISDITTTTNGPVAAGSGYLIVVKKTTAGHLAQLYIATDNTAAYYRYFSNNAWGGWSSNIILSDGDSTRY